MHVPADFSEEKAPVPGYTCLFDKKKSPLGLAIKYSSVTTANREKHISIYFSQSPDSLSQTAGTYGPIHFRETVVESNLLSVYSLRFAVEVKHGLLFGCFNCTADCKDEWRRVVLEMLLDIEAIEAI